MTDLTKLLCYIFRGRCTDVEESESRLHDDVTSHTQHELMSNGSSISPSTSNHEEVETVMTSNATVLTHPISIEENLEEKKILENHETIDISPLTEEEIFTNDPADKELEERVIHEILVACQAGDIEVFRRIHENYPHLVGNFNKAYVCSVSFDDMPLTLLQLSCVCGREEIVLYILSQSNVNVNAVDPITRSTALHIAVCMENSTIVHILCSFNDTDINLQNIDGKTAMQIAIERQLLYIVEIMLTAKHSVMNWYLTDLNKNNIFHILSYNPDEAIVLVLAFAFNNLERLLDERNQSLEILLEVSVSTSDHVSPHIITLGKE